MTQYLATCKTHSVVRIYVICDVCVCLSARHLIWNWIMFMFGIISIVFYVRSASAIISHHKYSTTHGHSVAESIYNSQYRQQFIHKILRLSRVWCVFSPIFFTPICLHFHIYIYIYLCVVVDMSIVRLVFVVIINDLPSSPNRWQMHKILWCRIDAGHIDCWHFFFI